MNCCEKRVNHYKDLGQNGFHVNLHLWHPLTQCYKTDTPLFKNTTQLKWHPTLLTSQKMEPRKNGTQVNCHDTLFNRICWFEISNQVPDSNS